MLACMYQFWYRCTYCMYLNDYNDEVFFFLCHSYYHIITLRFSSLLLASHLTSYVIYNMIRFVMFQYSTGSNWTVQSWRPHTFVTPSVVTLDSAMLFSAWLDMIYSWTGAKKNIYSMNYLYLFLNIHYRVILLINIYIFTCLYIDMYIVLNNALDNMF